MFGFGGMYKGKKKIKDSFVLETLSFFNQKIDFIVGKSELINELLEEIDDPVIIEKLNEKLIDLEKEIDYIGKKIDLEQRNLKKS